MIISFENGKLFFLPISQNGEKAYSSLREKMDEISNIKYY